MNNVTELVFTMTNDELAAAIEAGYARLKYGTSGWDEAKSHYIKLMAEQHRRAIARTVDERK